MKDKNILDKLPKMYHKIIKEIYCQKKQGEEQGKKFIIKLADGYTLNDYPNKNTVLETSLAKALGVLRKHLSQPLVAVLGGKREGAGRKSKGYKMVSIRMTEQEKIAVKEFLDKIRNKNI